MRYYKAIITAQVPFGSMNPATCAIYQIGSSLSLTTIAVNSHQLF